MSLVTLSIKTEDYWRLFNKIHLCTSNEQKKIKQIKIGQNFCQELEAKGISYSWCIKHPEVLGCNQSRKYYQRYQEYLGSDYSICKHLVVHERKGQKRVFLIIVDDEKSVDLKELKEQIGCSKLEFVSNSELDDLLHTVPGNVSLFHMKFDIECKVNLIMDKELLEKSLVAFHPLYNGMSLFLTPDNALKYLNAIHRVATIMDIPSKNKEYVLEKVM